MSQLIHRTLKQIGRRLSANGIDANIRFSLDPPPAPSSSLAEISISGGGGSSKIVITTNNNNNNYPNDNDNGNEDNEFANQTIVSTISGNVANRIPETGSDDEKEEEESDEKTIQKIKKKKNSEPNINDHRKEQKPELPNFDTSQMIIGSVAKVDESGFKQWHNAMRMVSRLPGGIPADFRQKLWLTMADRNIQRRKIDWPEISNHCFNDKNNPDDEALGIQIVKDLHRTGCSLFSGGELHNQALLKQVLLAYARWNKSVGYCQGFNMLAAIILEVMEGNVNHSLKVMIYLIEDVLPESYFANNLRGLSVDMAVFRDLMRLKLSELAKHLDCLQYNSYDPQLDVNYEPPLINVFTMQWFLTLFANCLPKSAILRIWDLIFLEGNEILLRTALAIWDCLADRILPVKSADEFYSIMGVLTREMMEFGITDTNEMISTICSMAPFPFPQLTELRERYIYNIRPLSLSIFQLKKGFVSMLNSSVQKLIDDDDDDNDSGCDGESNNNNNNSHGSKTEELVQKWFEDQFVVANWCLNSAANSASKMKSPSKTPSPINGNVNSNNNNSNSNNNIFDTFLRQLQVGTLGNGGPNNSLSPSNGGGCASSGASAKSGNDSTRTFNQPTLDISMLKKQYLKLKQRQKQAQLILAEGFRYERPSSTVSSPTTAGSSGKEPFSMSQLLSGKTALIARKCRKVSLLNQDVPRARFNGTNLSATGTIGNGKSTKSPALSSNSSSSSVQRSHVYQRSNTVSSLMVTTLSSATVPKCPNLPSAPPLTSSNVPSISIVGQQTYCQSLPQHQHQPNSSHSHRPLAYDLLMVQPAQANTNYYSNNSAIGAKYRRSYVKSSSSSTSTELCDEIIGGGGSMDDIDDEDYLEQQQEVNKDAEDSMWEQTDECPIDLNHNNNNNNNTSGNNIDLIIRPGSRRQKYSRSYDDIAESLSFEEQGSPIKDGDCDIKKHRDNTINDHNNNNSQQPSRAKKNGNINRQKVHNNEADDEDYDDVFQISTPPPTPVETTTSTTLNGQNGQTSQLDQHRYLLEHLDSEDDSPLESRIRQFQNQIEQIKIEQSIN